MQTFCWLSFVFVFIISQTGFCREVPSYGQLELQFREWKLSYSKVYTTSEEEMRFQNYLNNVETINKLNSQFNPHTYFAANQFAAMSLEEFRGTVLMPGRSPPSFESSRYTTDILSESMPDSFNWTTQKVITNVKDQGSGGTCWAFSTIGNIEGQWALQTKNLTSLSVEQVVDCDGEADQKLGHGDCGVYGGWPYLAYQYIEKAGGLETEADYWYCSGLGGDPGTCFNCPAPGYNKTLCGPPIPYCNMSQSCMTKLDPSKFVPGLHVIDWKAIPKNESVMADQLMKIGPLSVAMNADLLQFYKRGVFDPLMCNAKALNHAVLLAGFGIEKDVFGIKPYWLVKNSWGEKWGEKGFFRIARGQGKCGINTQVTTAVLKK